MPGAYGAEMLTKKGVFGVVGGHQNRHLVIDPKSGALYVGVDSVGNVGVEPEPKATIQRFDPDGSLLVADDTGGTIWRISYKGTTERAAAPAEKTTSQAVRR